jgi:hypothetical protein
VSEDALHALAARLRGVDDEPLGAHADVLEEVHRGLVAELEALAGAGAPTRRAGR